MQATAARAIIDYAAGDDEFTLSDGQVAEVERRLDNPERTYLSLAKVRDGLGPFGV